MWHSCVFFYFFFFFTFFTFFLIGLISCNSVYMFALICISSSASLFRIFGYSFFHSFQFHLMLLLSLSFISIWYFIRFALCSSNKKHAYRKKLCIFVQCALRFTNMNRVGFFLVYSLVFCFAFIKWAREFSVSFFFCIPCGSIFCIFRSVYYFNLSFVLTVNFAAAAVVVIVPTRILLCFVHFPRSVFFVISHENVLIVCHFKYS